MDVKTGSESWDWIFCHLVELRQNIASVNWLVCSKELRRQGYNCNNIYYLYQSGLLDYSQYYSPSI